MKRLCSIVILLMAVLVVSTAAQAQSKNRESMIVSTEWLAKHLKYEDLVLLQIGDKKEYEAAHIPAAQHLPTSEIATPRGQG